MAKNTDPATVVARRTRYYKTAVALILLPAVAYLGYALSALLLPVLVGGILAYLSYPVTFWLRRKGLNRGTSVFLFASLLLLSLFTLLNTVRSQLPGADEQIRLRTTAQYKLNNHYRNWMIPPEQTGQGFLKQLVVQETNAMMDQLNHVLQLSEAQKHRLQEILDNHDAVFTADQQQRLERYSDANERLLSYTTGDSLRSSGMEEDPEYEMAFPFGESVEQTPGTLTLLVHIFSTWLIMPIVFFFLLLDDGKLKKQIISMVPNMFFEMTLTSVHNVDKAIGSYLRGTISETLAIFALFLLLLPMIGFSLGASLLIGLFAALTNIIPVFGPLAGAVACVGYALIIEDPGRPFPAVNEENIIIYALIVVLFIQAIDNIFLKPYILGSATDLHPLTVIFVVIAGGILLGFWGVLFSIPLWVILKVSCITVHKRLKLYGIIQS
jgi:predicted PurR-regulated permease PerM